MNTFYPRSERGIVHRAKNTPFCYEGWPSVAVDENGTLYAVSSAFRVGHVCPFGKTAMYISRDGGKTWTPPIVINDTYMDDRDAGILYMGNGRMLVTWFTHSVERYREHYGEHIPKHAVSTAKHAAAAMLEDYLAYPGEETRGGSYLRISEDYGVTWSETVKLPITAPHGPTLCRDGSLAYLGCEHYTYGGLPEKANALYKSYDGGYTWELAGTIENPEWLQENWFLCEPHVIDLPDGRLLGAFRVEGEFTLAFSESTDGGKTWSPVTDSGIKGSPPHLLLHSSGALICSFGYRTKPHGEHALISHDLGKTWDAEYIIDDTCGMWDHGYPCTVELPDGSLFTVYYRRAEGDDYCSLHYTRWML
ncbi:MAG: exo-alpha-sialidase [Clostridia bacterium]|nr:exo-alpha-sialidase [Clostridia bacterium]